MAAGHALLGLQATCKQTVCCMCLTMHNRLAGRAEAEAVYPKVGTVITDTHQDVLGLASVKVLANQIAMC